MLLKLGHLRTLNNRLAIGRGRKLAHSTLLQSQKHLFSSFFEDPDSQIVKKYLNNEENQIRSFTEGKFKFERVIVPRNYLGSEQLARRLVQEWKDKKIILNVDSSALIGSKRLVIKNHLEQNVYQGLSKPESVFSEQNPSTQLSFQQLKFDQNHFLLEDSISKQTYRATQKLPETQQQRILQQKIAEVYDNESYRYANRLRAELNVPQEYCPIVQLAAYNQNEVYFCGINQYSFRNLLSKYLSLADTQKLFMLSLKFAEAESCKYKLKNIQNQNIRIEQKYHKFARQFVYLKHYKIIKKIENGELIRRIGSFINNNSVDKDNNEPLPQQNQRPSRTGRRSRRQLKNMAVQDKNNIIVFARQFTLETIESFVLIKNLLSNADYEQIPNVSPSTLYSPAPLQKPKATSSKQTDSQKIEKHAILEVMLGSLWNKPYTLNRFPYLSENFHKLSQQDKIQVKNLFNQKLAQYTGAKRIFYQKNINKLDQMDPNSQQFQSLKRQYEQKREQQQKIRQQMDRRSQQLKTQAMNPPEPKKSTKSQHKYQQNYQQSKQPIIQNRKKTKQEQIMQKNMKKLQELSKKLETYNFAGLDINQGTKQENTKRRRSRTNKKIHNPDQNQQ